MNNNNNFLNIENNVLKRCDKSAFGEIIIPEGVEKIEACAFEDCCHVTKITMPDTINDLGSTGVFRRCTSLESIILSENIDWLTSDCFSECVRLQSIKIPQNVKKISSDCFSGCVKLETIHLPQSIDTIDSGTFENCLSLNSITIPKSVKKIYSEAFVLCI